MGSMYSLNVLVSADIGDANLRKITAIDSRISLRNISSLSRAESDGDPNAREKLDLLLAEAEVLFGTRFLQNITARAPKLKWIQAMSAGVNSALSTEIAESPLIITSVSGINSGPVGELVLGLMLMFVKKAPLCFQLKQEKKWRSLRSAVLQSKTVGIVGLGNIGREVARLSKAFGMRVLATRRSVSRHGKAPSVDKVFPQTELPKLLKESDFVVLAVPLTQETNKFFGEENLRTMKPTAYLINVSRGDVVDEEALIRGLDEHWITGAGLDVFSTEPLPVDSRLWELPNVILSPHISGITEDYASRVTELFSRNLKLYLDGEPLINVIDKVKGY